MVSSSAVSRSAWSMILAEAAHAGSTAIRITPKQRRIDRILRFIFATSSTKQQLRQRGNQSYTGKDPGKPKRTALGANRQGACHLSRLSVHGKGVALAPVVGIQDPDRQQHIGCIALLYIQIFGSGDHSVVTQKGILQQILHSVIDPFPDPGFPVFGGHVIFVCQVTG